MEAKGQDQRRSCDSGSRGQSDAGADLKMEEGVASQGMQALPEAGKGQAGSRPWSLKGDQRCQHLELAPGDPCLTSSAQNCHITSLCRFSCQVGDNLLQLPQEADKGTAVWIPLQLGQGQPRRLIRWPWVTWLWPQLWVPCGRDLGLPCPTLYPQNPSPCLGRTLFVG